MQDAKVMRLVGLASAVPYDRTDPFNPVNRRISIIVMNKRTEESITKDAAIVEAGDEEEARSAMTEMGAGN